VRCFAAAELVKLSVRLHLQPDESDKAYEDASSSEEKHDDGSFADIASAIRAPSEGGTRKAATARLAKPRAVLKSERIVARRAVHRSTRDCSSSSGGVTGILSLQGGILPADACRRVHALCKHVFPFARFPTAIRLGDFPPPKHGAECTPSHVAQTRTPLRTRGAGPFLWILVGIVEVLVAGTVPRAEPLEIDTSTFACAVLFVAGWASLTSEAASGVLSALEKSSGAILAGHAARVGKFPFGAG
jgi:hypothetical protein